MENVIWLIKYWSDLTIYSILYTCSIIFLLVYLIFYFGKKPSCLFSTTLIFAGVNRIYSVLEYVSQSLIIDFKYLGSADIGYIILMLLAKLISGIMYMIIAVKLYKEIFSSKQIAVLGGIAFVAEIFGFILLPAIMFKRFYFSWSIGLFLLFFIYSSIIKPNSNNTTNNEIINDDIIFCRNCGQSLPKDSLFAANAAPRF